MCIATIWWSTRYVLLFTIQICPQLSHDYSQGISCSILGWHHWWMTATWPSAVDWWTIWSNDLSLAICGAKGLCNQPIGRTWHCYLTLQQLMNKQHTTHQLKTAPPCAVYIWMCSCVLNSSVYGAIPDMHCVMAGALTSCPHWVPLSSWRCDALAPCPPTEARRGSRSSCSEPAEREQKSTHPIFASRNAARAMTVPTSSPSCSGCK